jgi:hypothetical protein
VATKWRMVSAVSPSWPPSDQEPQSSDTV